MHLIHIEIAPPKYETLASQIARKKNEENLAVWADFMDTSWEKFKKAYVMWFLRL